MQEGALLRQGLSGGGLEGSLAVLPEVGLSCLVCSPDEDLMQLLGSRSTFARSRQDKDGSGNRGDALVEIRDEPSL